MRSPSRAITRLAFCFVLACGGDIDGAASVPAVGATEHDARFVGTWVIGEYRYGTEIVERWRLHDDGRLAPLDERRDGLVIAERGAVTCGLGDRWSSRDARWLVFALTCSDSRAREATLRVGGEPSMNASLGAELVLVGVDGQAGWDPRADPGWTLGMTRR